MVDLNTLPDTEAEESIYETLRSYDSDSRLKYTQIGLMALAVHKRMLWQKRIDPEDGFPCRSFARYIRICCPYGFSTVYAALRHVEALPHVPEEQLAQIPQSNIPTMLKLSTAVACDPLVLEAAKGRSEAFVAYIREKHPDQHIPTLKPVKVMVDDPDFIYSVLDQAVELHDAIDRGHALQMVCAMARKSWELESSSGGEYQDGGWTMSEFLCRNCGTPMKVLWDESKGYYPEHYGGYCMEPEFCSEDAEILDNDYAE